MNSQCDQLTIGLIAHLVVRALHQYCRDHGFESRSSFFQVLSPRVVLKLCT